MRWLGDRESENVEDTRGAGGGARMAVGGGLGAIVVVVAAFFLGVDPSILLEALSGDQSQQQTQTQPQTRPGGPVPGSGAGSSRPPDAGHRDTMRQFVSVVLADTAGLRESSNEVE